MTKYLLRYLNSRKLRVGKGFALGLAAILAASFPALSFAGLIINTQDLGGTPPPNLVGGGNLANIVETAVGMWERAYDDPNQVWNLNLGFEWADTGTQNGQFVYIHQGGDPNRITDGKIMLNNTGFTPFFADPTPNENSEYKTYLTDQLDTTSGPLNSGRIFVDPKGVAIDHMDLLSIVLHEIGHSLGISHYNNEYNAQRAKNSGMYIEIQSFLPFSPLAVQQEPYSDHIYFYYAPMSLMRPMPNLNERDLISGLDVLVNAQISHFQNPNLNPYDLPEPSSMLQVLTGLVIMIRSRSIGNSSK